MDGILTGIPPRPATGSPAPPSSTMGNPFQFPPLVRGGKRSLEDLGLILLPQDTPPRNATFLDLTRVSTVPAGIVGTPGTALVIDYLTPPNRRGVLRRLGVEPSDPAAMSAIQFNVLRSGAPVPNYQRVQAPIGTIERPDEVYVEYDREQRLQVVVSNSNTTFDYEVHVRVVGWFWDIQVEAGR